MDCIACQAPLSSTIFRSLLKCMSIESVMLSNHIILCCLHLLGLQSFPSSGSFQLSQLFVSDSQSISASASASVFPMSVQDFSRDQWFDLFAVQGTLKSLLQHHSSKPSILWCSAFFMVHLPHLSMTTGKTIALTSWTSIGKVMSLLFSMLSRFVIAFQCLLISWLQSLSTVILEPKKYNLSLLPVFPLLFAMK